MLIKRFEDFRITKAEFLHYKIDLQELGWEIQAADKKSVVLTFPSKFFNRDIKRLINTVEICFEENELNVYLNLKIEMIAFYCIAMIGIFFSRGTGYPILFPLIVVAIAFSFLRFVILSDLKIILKRCREEYLPKV